MGVRRKNLSFAVPRSSPSKSSTNTGNDSSSPSPTSTAEPASSLREALAQPGARSWGAPPRLLASAGQTTWLQPSAVRIVCVVVSFGRALVALLWMLPSSALAEDAAPVPPTSPAPAPYPPPPGYAPPGWYAPPPGYGPPGYYAPPPAYPAPGPNPTARRHDGFYLRMGLGLGWGYVKSSGTLSIAGGSQPLDMEATYDGLGPAYELLIGGTIARGLVLGGGFVGQDIQDPTLSKSSDSDPDLSEEMTVSGFLGVGALGPFLDWFPNDRGGLHFGTMLGLALLGLSSDSGKSSFGLAGALWGGHDFWIGDQWSLGAEARVVALRSSREFTDLQGTLKDKAITIEVLFTAVYH